LGRPPAMWFSSGLASPWRKKQRGGYFQRTAL
jgi:hypothetical protein